MKGVLLAGGLGTRLKPLTDLVNKHLLPVYDRPMIEYPLETLKNMGCYEAIIVSGGEHIGGFADYLGDGSRYRMEFTYKVQEQPGGIAQALGCVEGFTDDLFPVILGDNYFGGQLFDPDFFPKKPTIFVSRVKDANRFGVYDGKKIVEKPKTVKEGDAVVGCYIYDNRVFDFIKTLKPSERGELEITDVNNWYLKKGMEVRYYNGDWSDMGTLESLYQVTKLRRQLCMLTQPR